MKILEKSVYKYHNNKKKIIYNISKLITTLLYKLAQYKSPADHRWCYRCLDSKFSAAVKLANVKLISICGKMQME